MADQNKLAVATCSLLIAGLLALFSWTLLTVHELDKRMTSVEVSLTYLLDPEQKATDPVIEAIESVKDEGRRRVK